jgi:hypothetical protein
MALKPRPGYKAVSLGLLFLACSCYTIFLCLNFHKWFLPCLYMMQSVIVNFHFHPCSPFMLGALALIALVMFACFR